MSCGLGSVKVFLSYNTLLGLRTERGRDLFEYKLTGFRQDYETHAQILHHMHDRVKVSTNEWWVSGK